MTVYNTINDYLQAFKVGDRICLGGRGVLDGVKACKSKNDIYKVHENTTVNKIVVTKYKCRKKLAVGVNYYDQEVGVLTNKEYTNLYI